VLILSFTFSVRNLSGIITAKDNIRGAVRSLCNDFSYDFTPGVYALTGDIYNGGWAFAYAITGLRLEKSDCFSNENTEYFINGKRVDLKTVASNVQYLGHIRHKKSYDKVWFNTVQRQIGRGIKKNRLPYSIEEIREMFHITKERMNRNIYYVGQQYCNCLAAIGFVNNKRIYSFPYLEQWNDGVFCPLAGLLKDVGMIVLMPMHDLSYLQAHDLPYLQGCTDRPLPYEVIEVNIKEIFMQIVLAQMESEV
jgi:hypothetical protein